VSTEKVFERKPIFLHLPLWGIAFGAEMDTLTIMLIAVGLAMDAFAVSISKGLVLTHNRRRYAILLASFFGGFQALMPLIGWFVGQSFQEFIMSIDHWIAFGFLSLIGAKMISDSTKKEAQNGETDLRLPTLLALAVATSIDALIVGLSFAFLQTSIVEPILLIGAITFSLSLVGFYFGCGLGRVFGNRIKIVGGLILIAIGIRILIEHLF
jgi:putative Mn2+ efflux pump MntP